MKKCFAVAILLILFSIFISCSKNETIQSISENELFQLSYGNFFQQLGVTDLNNSGEVRYGIAMQDGFFYIVNGEAQKIMELNSYGDLLTLFYNEDSKTAKFIDTTNSRIKLPGGFSSEPYFPDLCIVNYQCVHIKQLVT